MNPVPGDEAGTGPVVAIIGAGIAGLLATAALAPGAKRIILLEQDGLPPEPALRRRVPQGGHVRALLESGLAVMETLPPGFACTAVAAGSLWRPARAGWRLHDGRGWSVPYNGAPVIPSQSSCQLEHLLRARVWALDLARAAAGDSTPLSPDETERLASMRDPQRRAVFAMTRKALRRKLTGMLACDPAEIRFLTGWNGKPALAPDLARAGPVFSVTHSGRYAMIAASHCGKFGIDLEAELPRRDGLRVAARFFAASARRLDSFAVDLPACRMRKKPTTAPAGPWCLRRLPAPPGYQAALAFRGTASCPQASLDCPGWRPLMTS